MNQPILSVQNLNLKFRLYDYKNLSLKELASNFFNKRIKKSFKEFHALKDINFNLYTGDRLGICKVYKPTSGKISSNIKITPLLEAGTAFNPEFTGRENIYLSGAIYGLNRLKIRKNIKEIIKFSELEEFIDIPVKNYSTGMYNCYCI